VTPEQFAQTVQSLENRAIEHTLLLKLIAKAAVLTAACAVVIALVIIFR
jgi:hypothetical protein